MAFPLTPIAWATVDGLAISRVTRPALAFRPFFVPVPSVAPSGPMTLRAPLGSASTCKVVAPPPAGLVVEGVVAVPVVLVVAVVLALLFLLLPPPPATAAREGVGSAATATALL